MIIEARPKGRRLGWIAAALIASGVWFGAVAASALIVPPPAAIVIAPDALAVVARLSDASILEARPTSIVVRSDEPDLPARLYGAGAWLVWPSWARMGCRPQPHR